MSNLLPYRKSSQANSALPGELIFMYRSRLGLTQAKLAELLGLKSGRMVLNWEGGLSLPTASKLKRLLEVLLHRGAFLKGQELVEALQLWQVTKDYHDAVSPNYTLFPQPDKLWLETLINELSARPKTVESSQSVAYCEDAALFPSRPASLASAAFSAWVKHNHNLPQPITGLIGREAVLEKAITLVTKPRLRLLTISGPGGTGKTRLAIEVANKLLPHFPGGVYLVELAGITSIDPVFLLSAIAKVLEIVEIEGETRSKLEEKLKGYLASRKILLVLDNFEHLIPVGPVLVRLLEYSPGLKLLITSRETLHLYGEYELPLPPLEIPSHPQTKTLVELAENPAIKLFTERAEAVAPDFCLNQENVQAIARICACLDGLPLALELIAPHIKRFPPASLLKRLTGANSSRLAFLEGGPLNFDERQQTLRNTLAWSYSLLTTEEKTLFARLGIFRGGFDLRAVQEICANTPPESFLITEDLVLLLLHKNLLRIPNLHLPTGYKEGVAPGAKQAEDGFGPAQTRYEMLETIREYAAEQLVVRGEQAEEKLHLKHARYYLELALEADRKFANPTQAAWVALFEADRYNLQAAINWTTRQEEAEVRELGLQIAAALGRYWRGKGYLSEGGQFFEITLAKNPQAPANLRAKALNYYGMLILDQGDYIRSLALFQASLALCREHSIKPGIAVMLNSIGLVAVQYQGDYEGAEKLFAESLALMKEMGDVIGSANTLNNMGITAQYRGNLAEAVNFYEESLAIHREYGNERDIAATLNNLGEARHLQGLNREALQLYQEAVEIFQELEDPLNIAACFKGVAFVAGASGHYSEAVQLLGAAEALRDSVGGVLPRMELANYEQHLEMLRQKLGEAIYIKAWQIGHRGKSEEILKRILPLLLQ